MNTKTISLTVLDYDLIVEYDYQPPESACFSYDAPYPGADESVEVTKVELCECKNVDILELLSEAFIEKIETRILELEKATRIGKLLWS
jgi:hypothetical protein